MTLFDASAIPNDRNWFPLRAPCGCGSETGYWIERSGQNVVRCGSCNSVQYNAPKTETGQKVRSISTRPDIKPSRRARVFAMHHNTCVGCGRRPPDVTLHVGHLLSVKQGRDLGASDDLLFADENLAPMCEECNIGTGMSSVSAALMYRMLLVKAKQPDTFRD